MSNNSFKVKNALTLVPIDLTTLLNPQAGDLACDINDNNKLKRYDISSGLWAETGAAGAGGINYVTNTDFEANSTGYNTYADAAAASPVDGTGGVATLTIAASATGPIRGTKSGLITKDAANRQGNGVSYDFTIAAADQAQILRVSFDYATSTNYADDDMRVYVYDVTNSQLIEVIDRTISANASSGKYVGSFQSNSNSLSYRLVLHVASTNATAYTVKIDNVIVGPQTLIKGPVVTDWITFSNPVAPINSNSAGSYSYYKYRRIGDSVEINYQWQSTGAGSGTSGVVIPIPTGIVPPTAETTAQVRAGTTNYYSIGGAVVFNTGSHILQPNGLYLVKEGTSSGMIGNDFASTTVIRGEALFKVQGWSSNVVLSEDSGNRKISVIAKQVAGQALTANVTNFSASTIEEDTAGAWSGSVFTAPESGTYIGEFAYNTTTTLGGHTITMYKDGVSFKDILGAGNEGVSIQCTPVFVTLTKGQTLSFRTNLSSTYANVRVSIAKLASPQTLAGSTAVYARAIQTSGQSIANTTLVPMVWDVAGKDDSHNAMASSGIYTVPVSGRYFVKTQVLLPPLASGVTVFLELYKNGSEVTILQYKTMDATSSNSQMFAGSDYLNCVKGDTIDVRVYQNSGSAKAVNTAADYNNIVIFKVD